MSNQSGSNSEDSVTLPEHLRDFFKNEFKLRPGEKLVRFCDSPEDSAHSIEELRQLYAAAGIETQELTFLVPQEVMGPNGPEIEYVEVRAIGPTSETP